MRRATSVALAAWCLAAAWGCSHALPEPVLIEQTSGTISYSAIARRLAERLRLDPADGPDAQSQLDVLTALLDFLVSEFGEPDDSSDVVIVRVAINSASHAHVSINEGGPRILNSDPLNFLPSERHYLVHELFHAYYQRDLSRRTCELEAWATYAELRYRYRDESNAEIRRELMTAYGISSREAAEFDAHQLNWAAAVASGPRRFYMLNALSLLERSREENRAWYSKRGTEVEKGNAIDAGGG